ncbi:Predicted protein [Taphrina deformans PYCC 5710]|uniref:L-Fucosyltransferase n=1 Tax=Taphrina deformans (strain PYCC 5710 / ATCC 11124 / CBS 356.35 / IMI 108563 / JCM 9778 / NBRC 8474) TaxID=1097556 RepID=R4XE63_TAPDE|nr:Predicted protein [Taphrina deformans PYCC 5710]|eukprot:CCG82735.1 Predicted protein [Taphrina deformans PYCC 5710]
MSKYTTYQPCKRPGGIGNIMSLVLNCVRYAIAAGASITLPLIEKRGQDLTALKNGVQEPMSYFFDDAFFRGVMALNCPQMTVLEDISQIREFGNAHVTDSLRPSELHADNGRLDMHTSEFQHALSGWLNFEPSLHHPAIIRLSLGLFEWPISEESVEFYATFGKLLRFREDVHQLANDILRTIQRQSSDNGRFLGAHLRTEADIKGLWIDYNDQRDAYFAKALSMTFKTIYLASGDLIDSARLKTEAAKRNIKVLTKRDLLSRANLRKLTSMTWDQQGLVDYLVLKNSTFFMGSSPSSFAFALAYSRHLNIADESYPFPEDSLSKIIGEDVNFFRDGMWPVQG